MSKHTPGPWEASDTLVYFGRYGGIDLRSAPDAEANAKLIAAAPDLLEALETIKRLMYEPRAVTLDRIEVIVDAAIAKAGG